MSPKISLVIPSKAQSAARLIPLLESIVQQNFRSFEVLIIFNGQKKEVFDSTKTELQKIYPQVQYHYVIQPGVNHARNFGIHVSKGLWIYFLDDDCRLKNSSHLTKCWELCQQLSKDFAAIGGPYLYRGPKTNSYSRVYHLIALEWFWSSYDRKFQTGHRVLGGNTLYRRELLRLGHLFDKSIVFGSSELDLNLRLLTHGYQILQSRELSVEHSHNLRLIDLVKKAYLQGKGFSKLQKSSLIRPNIWSLEKPKKSRFQHLLKKFYTASFQLGHKTHEGLGAYTVKKLHACLLLLLHEPRSLRFKFFAERARRAGKKS